MITKNTTGADISNAFISAVESGLVSYDMKLFKSGTDIGGEIQRVTLNLGAGVDFDEATAEFIVGGVYTTQFTATLGNPTVQVTEGDALTVNVGVEVSEGTYEYVTVAKIEVTSVGVFKEITTITGVGAGVSDLSVELTSTDTTYESPERLGLEITGVSGVSIAFDSQLTKTAEITIPASTTCLQALQTLALFLGGFAYQDYTQTGKNFTIAKFSNSPTFELPIEHLVSKPNMLPNYSASGLTVLTGTDTYTYGDGRVKVTALGATEDNAAEMWANLQNLSFAPWQLQLACVDPRVTPADVARVRSEDFTPARNVPTRGISVVYDGGYYGTYAASGLTVETEQTTRVGEVTQKVTAAQIAANEAQEIANAVGQHFWTDTQGAHVTDDTQDNWETEYAKPNHGELSNPTDQKPWYNQLIGSMGTLVRTGLINLAAWTRSALAFYDGLGNSDANIIAQFGRTLARIGYAAGRHADITSDGFSVNDGETQTAFFGEGYITKSLTETHVYDTFSSDGVYKVTDFPAEPWLYTIDLWEHLPFVTSATPDIYANFGALSVIVDDVEYIIWTCHYNSETGEISRPILSDIGEYADVNPTSAASMLAGFQQTWDDVMQEAAAYGTELYFGNYRGYMTYTTNYYPYNRLELGSDQVAETTIVGETSNYKGKVLQALAGTNGTGNLIGLGDTGGTVIVAGEYSTSELEYGTFIADRETPQVALVADDAVKILSGHSNTSTGVPNEMQFLVNGNTRLIPDRFNATAVPSSNIWITQDVYSGSDRVGSIATGRRTNGTVTQQVYIRNPTANVSNYLELSVADDGTRTVSVPAVQPWLDALGLGSMKAKTHLPLTSAAADYNTATAPYYAKFGKVVQVGGAVKPTAEVAAGGTMTFATLPTGCRPQIELNVLCQGSGTATWLLTIATNGQMIAKRYRNGTTNQAMTTSVWLPFSTSFIVA